MASESLQVVEIWTDGGCRPNPGPGGWAAILKFKDAVRELSGAEAETTNNRMELTAAAEALEALKAARVRLFCIRIAEYLKNGITRWHAGWVRKNWRNAAGRSGEEYGFVAADIGGGEGAYN